MRLTALLGASIVIGLLAIPIAAQSNAQERAANLRDQLVDLEATQTDLQIRLQQLEEELKPENIERSLAGVGSVHPEELREARRRQLEDEKRGVESQLEILATSRTRLEAAISRADAESYWQSAGVNQASTTSNGTAMQTTSVRPRTRGRRSRSY